MVSFPNKRQQARNERALQDLIRTIPGNERCADCETRNPGWASWNLGVFLCMRCAALHRKIGTHISKVKSLSMDSWSVEQVDSMKSNGNMLVNKIYNPRNVKPPVPIDIDEADSAMERFIRQKYEHRILEDGKPKPPSRDDSGYHTYKSSEESPPPLPPKSRKFGFGLRSVSSTSHLPQSSERDSNPSSVSPRSATFGSLSPSIPINKQSRVFGTSLGEMSSSFESKLEVLRDMGFPDDRRNATVLKGLSGNLERTIESLVRLGEGNSPGSRSRTPVPKTTPTSGYFPSAQQSPNPNTSTNPFDQLDAPKPRQASNAVPVKSYNPFDAPIPQPAALSTLETSFQNLQVSQPLFPHSTGGYPTQQGQVAPTSYQHPLTPPVLPSSQMLAVAPSQSLNGGYNPFFQSAAPLQPSGGNPYFPQTTQSFSPSNPFFGHMSPQSTGALQQAQAAYAVPPLFQTQNQHGNTMPSFTPSIYSQPAPPQQQQQQHTFPQTSYNPFDSSTTNANPSITLQQPQPQPQSLFSSQPNMQTQFQQPLQRTSRVDKNSILALYNLAPPMASNPMTQQTTQVQQQSDPLQSTAGQSPVPSLLTNSLGSTPQTQSPFSLPTPQRGATIPEAFGSPLVGTRNPYMNSTTLFAGQPQTGAALGLPAPSGLGIGLGPKALQVNNIVPRAHMSQGSVDVSGMQTGRHSPDAFASLSARYV